MTTVRLHATLLPPVERHTFIEVKLDRYDIDGAIYVPAAHLAYFDKDGRAALDLWPNERGSRSSVYLVRVASPRSTLLRSTISLPDDDAVDLRDVLEDRLT